MSHMTADPHEMHGASPAPDPYGERLTVEQYEQAAPLLRLADLGRTEKLAESLKPGELKRRELKRRAIEGLRSEGTINGAAAAADVPPSTIYRWRKADPEFDAAVTEFLHVDMVDTLEASAFRIATSTDPKMANAAVRAQELLLKAYDPDRFTERHKIESTQTVNHMVQVVHTVRENHRAAQVQALQRLKTLDAEPRPALPEGENV